MQFDVIIGNPPYQLSDGGARASAKPLYHLFIEQSLKMLPLYLCMIVPARWYSGGRGLDAFRKEMLNDKRLKEIHDFPNASDVFPGVEIKGGVCYFLWDRERVNANKCAIHTHLDNDIETEQRLLLEEGMSTFIRYNKQVSIFHKVKKQTKKYFIDLVSANDPFGFDVRMENSYKRIKPNFKLNKIFGDISLYYYGWQKKGIGYINGTKVRKGKKWVKDWKVYISRAYGAGESYPHQILNKPFVGEPNSVCTETYTLIGPFKYKHNAENVVSYIKTKFFRFIVSLIKNTQSSSRRVYSLVPMQDFDEEWTDVKLYKKYGLPQDEIDYIERMIKSIK